MMREKFDKVKEDLKKAQSDFDQEEFLYFLHNQKATHLRKMIDHENNMKVLVDNISSNQTYNQGPSQITKMRQSLNLVNMESQILEFGRKIRGNESFLQQQKQTIKDLRIRKIRYKVQYRDCLLKALFSSPAPETKGVLEILREVKAKNFSLDHPESERESPIIVDFYKYLLEGNYLEEVMQESEETRGKCHRQKFRQFVQRNGNLSLSNKEVIELFRRIN